MMLARSNSTRARSQIDVATRFKGLGDGGLVATQSRIERARASRPSHLAASPFGRAAHRSARLYSRRESTKNAPVMR